jgi:hypothetical protein
MPSDTIAIIPNMGYQPPRRYSPKGCLCLSSFNGNIRNAGNEGEVTLGPYTVYGCVEESRTVYEFYGCYLYDCPDGYPNLATEMHPHRIQKTYQDLYEET